MPIGGDAGQLKIGVDVLRIEFEGTLEIRLSLHCVPTGHIMVAEIIQKCQRWRSLRQGLLVDALRFTALLFRIQLSGLPQGVFLRIRKRG